MFGMFPFGAGYFADGPGVASPIVAVPRFTRVRGLLIQSTASAYGLRVASTSQASHVRIRPVVGSRGVILEP